MSLFRTVFIGAIICSATLVSISTLVACTDERAPETYVKRLEDPRRRVSAVKRLVRFYEDAMTQDKKDRSGPHVKPLLDLILPSLAKVSIDGVLDERSQAPLLSFLADTRDARALPAIAKALIAYRPDDRGPEDYDSSIIDVVRGVGYMARQGNLDNADVKKGMLKLFKGLQAFSPKGQNKKFYQVLNGAMLDVADASWESELIAMVKVPIKSTQKKVRKKVLNQVFWQVTASEVLGKLKSKKAVKPLLKVVLTPFKTPVHSTAINALIKIGGPAIADSVKLLDGSDADLNEYAASEYLRSKEDQGGKITASVKKDSAKHASIQGVVIVAFMGTGACIEPMLGALAKGDDSMKAFVASELAKLPASDEVTARFKKAYDATKLGTKTPRGGYAKEGLASAVEAYFDLELAKWLGQSLLGKMRGEKEDVDALRQAALPTLIKSATPETWVVVEKVYGMFPPVKGKAEKFFIKGIKDKKDQGPFTEQQIVSKIVALELEAFTFREAKDGSKHKPMQNSVTFQNALRRTAYVKAMKNGKKLLDECAMDAKCYVKKLTSKEGQDRKTDMIGLKAAYMAAALGGPGIKKDLIKALGKIKSRGVRSQVALAIDRLSPKGDKVAAAAMQKIIDKAAATRIQSKIDAVKGLKQFIYRLEARGG
ncbi:MAG: hypothetical protein VB934_11655 [Polyangiaceae bacterium]